MATVKRSTQETGLIVTVLKILVVIILIVIVKVIVIVIAFNLMQA